MDRDTRPLLGRDQPLFTVFMAQRTRSSVGHGALRFLMPETQPSLIAWKGREGWREGMPIALRALQAESTRRLIIDAPTQLFVQTGYSGTSVDAIAEAAGVSRATVFTAVGGKATILKTADDVALVGDDDPVPLPPQPESLAIRAEPHPRRYLE